MTGKPPQSEQVLFLFLNNSVTHRSAGEFIYWDENKQGKRLSPISRAGSVVDGSKIVHSATVYGKSGLRIFLSILIFSSHEAPPRLDKDKDNKIIYVGNDKWQLVSDNEGSFVFLSLILISVIREYDHDDLRISIVYRARCFKDAAESEAFNKMKDEDKMTLESIFDTFKNDLVERKVKTREQLDAMTPLDFSFLILSEFIRYPLPSTPLIPYNYCALSVLIPALKPVLKLIC